MQPLTYPHTHTPTHRLYQDRTLENHSKGHGGGGSRTPVRNSVTTASTRVFRLLNLAVANANEQAVAKASGHVRVSLRNPATRFQSQPAVDASLRLAGVGGETSRHFKPRELTLCQHLYVFPDILTRPTGVLGAQLQLQLQRRNLVAPISPRKCGWV